MMAYRSGCRRIQAALEIGQGSTPESIAKCHDLQQSDVGEPQTGIGRRELSHQAKVMSLVNGSPLEAYLALPAKHEPLNLSDLAQWVTHLTKGE